jgi:hemolysin activation/secretion protein
MRIDVRYTPFVTILSLNIFALSAGAAAQDDNRLKAGTVQKLNRPSSSIIIGHDLSRLSLDRPIQSQASLAQTEKDTRTVEISRLAFVGNSTIEPEVLSTALAPYLGRALTIAELGQLADAATAIYRNAGYNVARVIIPPQDIVDGTLQLIVLEGRLASSGIEISDLSEGQVTISKLQSILERHIDPADPIQRQTYERALYLLELLPGVTIRSFLYPGDEVGAARLLVEVYATPVISTVVAADNYGSRATGSKRLTAYSQLDNMTGNFERVELSASSSGPGTRYAAGRLTLPVGSDGLAFGVIGEALNYEEIDDFDSGDEHGYSWSLGMFATYPVYLDAVNSHFIHGSINHHNQIDKGDVIAREEQDIENIEIELRGSLNWQQDNLAQSSYRLFSNAGQVDFRAGSDDDQTDGNFASFGFNLSHTQPIGGPFSSKHNFGAQTASTNLNGLFRCYVGGPDSGRGYPVGAMSADECVTFDNELFYDFPKTFLQTNWRLGAFLDMARARERRETINGQSNDIDTLVSTGLSLQAVWAEHGIVRAAIGRQLRDTKQRERTGLDSDGRDRQYHGWVQFALYF